MRDVDRNAITKLVSRKLADPSFRERLTAKAPDGSHPITVALREDPMGDLIAKLVAVGDASNVVVPLLNGFVVIAMTTNAVGEGVAGGADLPLLTTDCTVGVFLQRARLDAGGGPIQDAVYGFVVEGPNHKANAGRAELVAVGG